MNNRASESSIPLPGLGEGHVAEVTISLLRRIFSKYGPADYTVRLWNGTTIPPETGPSRFTLVLGNPGALRHMVWPPTALAAAEAFLRGDFDIEGDIVAAMALGDSFLNAPRPLKEWLGMGLDLLRLPVCGTRSASAIPPSRLRGKVHSKERDLAAVQYHYDLANEFYALWLDSQMVYSCAYFPSGRESLDEAQEAKLELICRKLELRAGERVLDVGCGWGGFLTFAAENCGVSGLGVTLSAQQVAAAQARARAAGLQDRVAFQLCDYRDLTGEQFDKIVSIGMAEHVGRAQMPRYFAQVWRLLKPGGLFLNQAIADQTGVPSGNLWTRFAGRNRFFRRYIFPDHELVPLAFLADCAEHAGFEVLDVEGLREHYARTARYWVERLETRRDEALHCVNLHTYRAWRLYLGMIAYAFEASRVNLYQMLLAKLDAPRRGRRGNVLRTRAAWYAKEPCLR